MRRVQLQGGAREPHARRTACTLSVRPRAPTKQMGLFQQPGRTMSLPMSEPVDYKTLVQDDRIHASLYTDPRVFADELERIFRRGWVFVGHDSEIPRPGDFVTRHLGVEPVVLVRGKDGGVAVLVNRWPRRGWG